jgi:hypothetical protein
LKPDPVEIASIEKVAPQQAARVNDHTRQARSQPTKPQVSENIPAPPPAEIASIESIAPEQVDRVESEARQSGLRPGKPEVRESRPAPRPTKIAGAVDAPAPTTADPQPTVRSIKGSIVSFDRTEQTVRILFSGAEPPPVGSMIQVQHTSVFGGNEFTILRVIRVDKGEVLARSTTNSRLQRFTRGDQAFYRPNPSAESKMRDPHVARAPTTSAGGTVWR